MRKPFSFLYILLALVLFAPVLMAETIYKKQDANGSTSFSDQPTPGSQKIEITPIPTYTPAPLPATSPAGHDNLNHSNEATAYEVSIVQPLNDETFTTDIESVNVHVSLTPGLQSGDKIQYLLNGKPVGALTNQITYNLGRLDRGTYLIKAQVIGSNGHSKGESKTITFYQHRTSILNRNF